jgi:arylsulfatase A-like enzyme
VPHGEWAPPTEPALRLLDLELRAGGVAPSVDASLADFDAEEIRRWRRSRVGDAVRFTTPRLRGRLDGVRHVRVRAHPGGAARVRVVPHVAVPEPADKQRLQRAVEVPLESGAAETGAVSLSFPLTDVLRDTWDDVERRGRLLGLEIDFVGASPGDVQLERVVLEGALAAFADEPAGRRTAAVDDVLRPAAFAHPGGHVRIPLRLPPGKPVLRWSDGAVGEPGPRRVRVIDGSEGTVVARIAPEGAQRWRPQEAPLERWAGREVVLEFDVDDSSDGKARGVGLFGAPQVVVGEPPPATPDVIVYMIDTLRADHVGAYVETPPSRTPHLDRLGGEGVVFEHLLSSSSWTKPAIPTLLTGLWPTTHRVGATANTDRLPATVPMIQDRFARRGWRAGSVTANPLGSTLSGLERGFDVVYPPRFWQGRVGELGHPSAAQLHDALLAWIDEEPGRPYFAYVHTVEVHEYHRPLYRRGGPPTSGYPAAVRDSDRKLGQLLRELRARGRDRNLLLVVVSDHGESLGEHDLVGHGMSLYQQELHVPLIVWAGDSLRARRAPAIASLADIAPTLADLCGLDPLPEIDGRSLLPDLVGAASEDRAFVPAALLRVLWRLEAPKEYAVLTANQIKLIRTEGVGLRAFDLADDPAERAPLAEVPAAAAGALDDWMEAERRDAAAFREVHGRIGSVELDRDTAERLRSLGYIE